MEKVVESVEKQIKSKSNQIVDTTISNNGSNITKSSEGIINSSNVCSSNNRIMVNNVDLPCTVVNNVYIDDRHLPVGRVNVLVVAEYCDNDVLVITNTDGDFIKNTNVDLIYDIVIRGGNPKYYYYGTMEHINLYGYYTKDSHMLGINKIEQCYVKKRLIFDDGG